MLPLSGAQYYQSDTYLNTSAGKQESRQQHRPRPNRRGGAGGVKSPTASTSKIPLHYSILHDMSRLYLGESLETDFVIHTGRQKHRAHRFVLMFRSRYFESLFRSGLEECYKNELTIDDVEPAIMEAILRYIYLGTFECDSLDQLIDLLIACK